MVIQMIIYFGVTDKMADPVGVEPTHSDPKSDALPLCKGSIKITYLSADSFVLPVEELESDHEPKVL
jgi:hypothetical protein